MALLHQPSLKKQWVVLFGAQLIQHHVESCLRTARLESLFNQLENVVHSAWPSFSTSVMSWKFGA